MGQERQHVIGPCVPGGSACHRDVRVRRARMYYDRMGRAVHHDGVGILLTISSRHIISITVSVI